MLIHVITDAESDAIEEGNGNNLEIVAGAEVENYAASELRTYEEDIKFVATLTIKEVTAEVARNKVYLVVENSEGSQKYFYRLTVKDKDTESTTESGGGDETTEGGSDNNGNDNEKKPGLSKSLVALIVVGLAVIACLGVGLWFFYERKRARVNTGPLAGQEQRP